MHPDVRERCLAHVVGDQVVEVYLRDDLNLRRVEVMEARAQFVIVSSVGGRLVMVTRVASPEPLKAVCSRAARG